MGDRPGGGSVHWPAHAQQMRAAGSGQLTALAVAELVNSPALQQCFTVGCEEVQRVLHVITSY